ncbi:probable COP9 signalosome subunit 5 CSN5 [Melanopsichium pennsylvanicum]|uniref:COP9 signalosome complex subunit 5 n=2 Tax=Melanopsichium pennsylvanicum TaxID=63383 RepID=A0AAJ4XMT3_9BASI|nr:probable COP9 signalosome subunit 5 CSN5 [Melanopsichium pennsylvanicum 4]SNX85234.1 probable COP9 signalosome subunit 5 CSN5 [Melanopsichium pennsylvanicum]
MASSSTTFSSMARSNFELNNDIITLDATTLDSIFSYDSEGQRSILRSQPWKSDAHFFVKVRISAVALIKMVMHARSGGIYEIMGLMQGKIDVINRTLYVMDSFALPVEGTETRVNAQNEAYEYMVQYLDSSREVGRLENVVGWYHSHPGYGCWLSGIDVNTQRTNQQFQDPFVAIVIDPNRTISSAKVDIGAFRTFPEGYTPASTSTSGGGRVSGGMGEDQSIPLAKIEDFGVHASQYYALEVEHFKSSVDTKLLDLLWNKYWQNTLSQSPLITNRAYTTAQIHDLGEKLAQTNSAVLNRKSSSTVPFTPTSAVNAVGVGGKKGAGEDEVSSTAAALGKSDNKVASDGRGGDEDQDAVDLIDDLVQRKKTMGLARASNDARKVAVEAQHGLLAIQLKSALFGESRKVGSGF